jgi:hypothetical protein
MELEATLVDKLQKALTKTCEDCGKVTGQALYYQLLGQDLECESCKSRNRMLYLPIKILLMKFTSMFGITEEELMKRLREDESWNRILETMFKRLKEGTSPDDLIKDSIPMVLELDLEEEGKGLEVSALNPLLKAYRDKGTIGVRYHKKTPFTPGETELIRMTKKMGFLISLAVEMPAQVKLGGLADTVDHVDLVFKDIQTFTSVSDSEIKDVLGGTILKPISIFVEEDMESEVAQEKAKELANILAPEAIIIHPKTFFPPADEEPPPDQKERMESYASFINSPDLKPFISVRDPSFVKWLGLSPGAANIEHPPIVVFRGDIEKWSLPPEDFLPVKSIFSLVPMHIGVASGAFSHRVSKEDLGRQ